MKSSVHFSRRIPTYLESLLAFDASTQRHEKTLRQKVYTQFIEKRRELIIFLSGAVAAWCRGAVRQPAVSRRFPNLDPSSRSKNYI